MRRIAVVLAISLLGAVLAAPARAAVPPADFVGVNDWAYPSAQTLQQFGGAELKNWRIPLSWASIESTKGTYNFTGYDTLMQNAAQNGVRLLFVVASCPNWACSDIYQPPGTAATKNALSAFVAAAVDRYGSQGSFWASHPTIPFLPVTHWQVWNEVNEERNLKSGEPTEYLELLRRVGQTIRARDTQAKIVLSGLVEKGSPKWLSEWLPAFYKLDPNVKGDFDIMAIHGYSPDPEGFFSILDQTRRIMSENGDGDKRLWVTEVGWGTEGPAHPFSPGLQLQQAFLKQAFDKAIACRNRWKLDRVFWFGLSNGDPRTHGLPDYWGFHNGLRYLDGKDKPAMATFLEYLGGRELGRADTCDLKGGDVVPDAPDNFFATKPSFYYNKLPVTLQFNTEPGSSLTCYFETNPPADCTAGFTTPSDLVEGIYKLTLRSIDANGEVGASQVFGFLLDLSPPSTKLRNVKGSRTTKDTVLVDWDTLDAGGVGEDYECRVDNGPWTACYPPFTTPAGLPDGEHVVEIRATDYAGNLEGTAARSVFFVDTKAPETNIPTPAAFTAPISFNDLSFTFVAYAQNATLECRLDAGEWAACTSPKDLTDVPDGSHVFEVRALDALGNADATPANRAFTIDSTMLPTAPLAFARKFTLDQALSGGFVRVWVQVIEPRTTIKLTVTPWKKSKKKTVAKGVYKNVALGPTELLVKLTKFGKKYLQKPKTRRFQFRLESKNADGKIARRKFSGRL